MRPVEAVEGILVSSFNELSTVCLIAREALPIVIYALVA